MNDENLKGHGFDEIAPSRQREIAKMGAEASAQARKKKKLLKDCLELLLQKGAGRDENGNVLTSAEVMSVSAVKAAMNGDWKAWELVRDTVGQKPVDKVMISEVDQNVINEVEQIVSESIEEEENE